MVVVDPVSVSLGFGLAFGECLVLLAVLSTLLVIMLSVDVERSGVECLVSVFVDSGPRSGSCSQC